MGRPRKTATPRPNPKLTSMGIYSTEVGMNKKNPLIDIINKIYETNQLMNSHIQNLQMQNPQPFDKKEPILEAPDAPETKSDTPPEREVGEEKEAEQTTTDQPKQSYLSAVMSGRQNFPPKAREVLKQYGDIPIKSIQVIRQPIFSLTPSIFNMLSFGKFQKSMEKQPYDELFHLRSVFTLENGKRIQVEKAHVINISTDISKVKGEQSIPVPMTKPTTINQLMEGAKKILGSNMYSYDGFKNNCQDFQIAIYKGAGMLTPELQTFIKQDVSEIAHTSPILSKFANMVTGIGGKFNEIIEGAGIHKKFNKTHLVQSVLFDKKKWKPEEAIEWLHDNNYHAPKLDKTTNFLRFRQLDPKDYPKPQWAYTTHRLGHGIDFIILYRQSKQELPITIPKGISKKAIHTIMTGSGDLIHIDLGSHNASGKRTKTLTGGALEHEPQNPLGFKSWNEIVGGVPMPSYKPYDMKLTTENKMLNNLKKSDLEDLANLQSQVKKSAYDREANIRKIKSITKRRVKSEVKKTRTATPRNTKTRGSPEAKIIALTKRTKQSKKTNIKL